MSSGRFERSGEIYYTLEAAASCFRVELSWIEEVYASGALGPGERIDGTIVVTDPELDRLAAIVRWHRHYELDLLAVLALLRAS
jgi:hypothetical protein